MATVNVPDLKIDWKTARRILYTALVVWVLAVRSLKVDPLALSKALPIAWGFDAISIIAITLVVWHLWDLRPKI